MLTLGYAARSPTTPLAPYAFDRRALRPDDVAIEIAYCGVCHTDLHFARNDWGWTAYPCVPGHEIVGRVTGSLTGCPAASSASAFGTYCVAPATSSGSALWWLSMPPA